MKTQCVILFYILIGLPATLVDAQSVPSEGISTNVAFAISAATNVFEVNTGVILTATITNRSDVAIGKTDRDRTFLSLTNSNGKAYHFSLKRSDYENLMFHSRAMAIEPNSTYEWPLAFGPDDDIRGKKIVPGTYVLHATCEFFTRTNDIYSLTSNPVEIRIQ